MPKMMVRLVAGLGIAALTALAADNSLGTWKLNMEKSKFSPSAPVKALTMVREASGEGVNVTVTGEQASGAAVHGSYSAKYDGSEAAVTGAPYDMITIKQVNANTFTETRWKKDGKYRVTARTMVSKDGKTLTNTVHGTNADGKAYSATMVWDKQ